MTSKMILTGGAAAAALLWSTGAFAQAQPPSPAEPPAEAPPQDPAPEPPPPPPAPPTIAEAITKGKPILEMRARYENVDQVGIAKTAEAYTLRTRLGWETASFHGFKALVEFEDVRPLAAVHYNVAVPGVVGGSLNGKTQFPVINDPQVTEVNRAQLTWTVNSALTLTGGRQRILVDDQRFIGNVGWRQDEQTFDAARADFAWGRLKGTYAYVWHVNRILGEAKDWDSDSHLVNLTYAVAEPLKLEGFLYALDFANSAANSNLTWGARASGKTWLSLFQLTYDATWARQQDYRNAPTPFRLDFYQADLAATFDVWTARVDYEVLQGNGARGFITPLATTHGFQGWSDAFTAVSGNKTFVNGIRDLNLQLVARPRQRWTYLFNIELLARWHDFHADQTGAFLGHEWDLQATAAVTPNFSIGLKYADFKRAATVPRGTAAPPASRDKVWVTLEYRL